MLSGSIQMNVDARGNKYEVPVFCINEPLSFSGETMAEKNLNNQFEDSPVKIKIRSVLFPDNDCTLEVKMSTTVEDIKIALRAAKNIELLLRKEYFQYYSLTFNIKKTNLKI